MSMAGNCDVCGRLWKSLYVASSATGPISLAFCQECIQEHAEPEWCFHYLYNMVSSDGDGLANWVDKLKTYKDDAYITWAQWKEWRQDPIRRQELDAKRDKELSEVN